MPVTRCDGGGGGCAGHVLAELERSLCLLPDTFVSSASAIAAVADRRLACNSL